MRHIFTAPPASMRQPPASVPNAMFAKPLMLFLASHAAFVGIVLFLAG
jgi:hypothetical protein